MKFKDFETRQVGDDTLVVLSEQSGDGVEKILKLNKTAAEILTLLSSGKSEQDTAMEISKSYEIEPEKAAADIGKVLTELKELGILE